MTDEEKKNTLGGQQFSIQEGPIERAILALEVVGYDPTAGINYAQDLNADLKLSLAVIAFFLGRITQKKIDVRPMLSALTYEESKNVLQYIKVNFSNGKTVTGYSDDRKEVKMNFSQVATSCLIISQDDLSRNSLFNQRINELFNNSSQLSFSDGQVNKWTYESYAYFISADDSFALCIAHMYWRMATTNGYLAPQISVSIKIRKFVAKTCRFQTNISPPMIHNAYGQICLKARTVNPPPMSLLISILESGNGKRNDDLNVTNEKNRSLQELAILAKKTIKDASKSQAKKSKASEEGEE